MGISDYKQTRLRLRLCNEPTQTLHVLNAGDLLKELNLHIYLNTMNNILPIYI